MKKYQRILQKLWLSERESLLYLDLLEYGASSASDIVARTHMHRPDVYKYLPVLVESGLVSVTIKGKRKQYSAESPEHIEHMFSLLKRDFDQVLPEMLDVYSNKQRRPLVKYMEWAKAITFVFDDIVATLKKWDVFYRLSAEGDVDRANSFLSPDYREKRDKKELERYVIMSEKMAVEKKPRMEREIVTIPARYDEFSDDVQMIIYGNKVAFIEYNSLATIIVENAFIAGFQKKVFMLLFRLLKGGK